MLFNFDFNGSEELQRITGIHYASNDFSVIASELVDARRTVAGLVGEAVIETAENEYEYGQESEVTRAVRTAIAILAVSRCTAANLVSHEDVGARAIVDEHAKIPFEWMIDRDERAQRERWFRAMDALYGLLEKTENQSWMESDIRKAFKASIVRSLQEFERVYPVDGSYYVYYMLQNLVIESQPAIRKMVGADNWEGMTGAAPSPMQKDLLALCQRYAVISALIKGVRRWNLEVFPLSIARRFSPTYQGNKSSRAALRTEIDAYIAGLEGQLDEIRDEIAETLSGENPFAAFVPIPHGDPRNKFFSAQ
jgi:hypothetical protein